MGAIVIALVGEFSAEKLAHQAIPRALELAGREAGRRVEGRWMATPSIGAGAAALAGVDGVWLVPGSPYEQMAGALAAARWARQNGRPFLGTCGGFQHALIEFARSVAGIAGADHAETNPSGEALIVEPLACGLVEKTARIHFAERSRMRAAYGAATVVETYHCSYGLNSHCRPLLERAGLNMTAWDDAGAVRGAEWPDHRFFVGTLFQPERAALRGEVPPLVRAFLAAAP